MTKMTFGELTVFKIALLKIRREITRMIREAQDEQKEIIERERLASTN